MKRKDKSHATRDEILKNLWVKHGCPEKMKIHVKSTGETINLIEGSPVTLSTQNNPSLMRFSKAQNRGLMVRQPVTLTRTCEGCKTQFAAQRKTAKYCSARCRQKAKREQEAKRVRLEHERLLAGPGYPVVHLGEAQAINPSL
jgi:hypothetical protein